MGNNMMAEHSIDANFLKRMVYTLAIKKPAIYTGLLMQLFVKVGAFCSVLFCSQFNLILSPKFLSAAVE